MREENSDGEKVTALFQTAKHEIPYFALPYWAKLIGRYSSATASIAHLRVFAIHAFPRSGEATVLRAYKEPCEKWRFALRWRTALANDSPSESESSQLDFFPNAFHAVSSTPIAAFANLRPDKMANLHNR
ncbi:hypothetical protein M514_11426 [Trichuris suis]|uniref:Uncharacterized protein n=1 Tax=Trichuris suis TaxID=68888 RepID=A0A085LRU7_9BILA|nr:hypothetical protein M513_11426 [Trichuris suis]KFD61651.1 hypothetical protein M514_11426 [Trichuris suis]